MRANNELDSIKKVLREFLNTNIIDLQNMYNIKSIKMLDRLIKGNFKGQLYYKNFIYFGIQTLKILTFEELTLQQDELLRDFFKYLMLVSAYFFKNSKKDFKINEKNEFLFYFVNIVQRQIKNKLKYRELWDIQNNEIKSIYGMNTNLSVEPSKISRFYYEELNNYLKDKSPDEKYSI